MKTIVIYHSRDLDGWMSAAIVKKWFIENNEDRIIFNLNTKEHKENTMNPDKAESLSFLGFDYGNKIPDLSEYDKVIICDVSFPKENMLELNLRLGKNFIWIDHHQRVIDEVNEYIIKNGIPMEGAVTEKGELKAACQLTWQYFFPNEKMPELVRLLGRYDCFGHKGTDEEKKVLEFQYGARQVISNMDDAYNYLHNCLMQSEKEIIENSIWQNGKAIYGYLCNEAKQTYTKSFPIEFQKDPDPKDPNNIEPPRRDKQYKFLMVNQDRFNPVNFGIDYHKDGYDGFACFWFKDNLWNFSLYNDNEEVDCSIIAKSFGGGGHKGASGFVMDNDQFMNLIK